MKNPMGFDADDYNRARPRRAATADPVPLWGKLLIAFMAGTIGGAIGVLIGRWLA